MAELKETRLFLRAKTDEGTLFKKEVMCEERKKIYYPYFAVPWNNN